MNDIDGWIYFEGSDPEHLRPLLDALRDLPPSTPEDKQRMARRLCEQLDAELAQKEEPPAATAATATTSAPAATAATSAPAPGGRRVRALFVHWYVVLDSNRKAWARFEKLLADYIAWLRTLRGS